MDDPLGVLHVKEEVNRNKPEGRPLAHSNDEKVSVSVAASFTESPVCKPKKSDQSTCEQSNYEPSLYSGSEQMGYQAAHYASEVDEPVAKEKEGEDLGGFTRFNGARAVKHEMDPDINEAERSHLVNKYGEGATDWLMRYRDVERHLENGNEAGCRLVFKAHAGSGEIAFTISKSMRNAVGLRGTPRGSEYVFDWEPKEYFMYFSVQYRSEHIHVDDYDAVFEMIRRHPQDMTNFRRFLDETLVTKLDQLKAVTLMQIMMNERLYELNDQVRTKIKPILSKLSTYQLITLLQDRTVGECAAQFLYEKLEDDEYAETDDLPVLVCPEVKQYIGPCVNTQLKVVPEFDAQV